MLVSTAMIPAPATEPPPPPPGVVGEPRYTLDEARRILAEHDCAVDGHDLEQLRVGAEIVRVICARCGNTFEPPQLPQVASSDVRVEVYSTGGRHSLRLTHIPTGLVAESDSEPSQLQNRERAMRILRARLLLATEGQNRAADAPRRRSVR